MAFSSRALSALPASNASRKAAAIASRVTAMITSGSRADVSEIIALAAAGPAAKGLVLATGISRAAASVSAPRRLLIKAAPTRHHRAGPRQVESRMPQARTARRGRQSSRSAAPTPSEPSQSSRKPSPNLVRRLCQNCWFRPATRENVADRDDDRHGAAHEIVCNL